ncbi:MAG: AMMECR1 domain-containing protein [bacterium]
MYKNGFYQGLLLPQVATENNWDREQFLNHTAMKAGLPPSAWNDPLTEIYKFQAQIFS